MTGILKSGSAGLMAKVRPFGAAATGTRAPPPPDPELERLRAALAAAETVLAARDDVIAGIPARIDEAFAEGEDKGRAEAEDGAAARLEALRDTAEEALVLYREEMASLERLAALLAQTCLDRMLIGSETRAEIVAEMLRAQLAALDAVAVVRIQVAAEDFPSPEALAALVRAPCEITASASAAPGDCTITLGLGALEVGIGQQWGTLRAALDEMAA